VIGHPALLQKAMQGRPTTARKDQTAAFRIGSFFGLRGEHPQGLKIFLKIITFKEPIKRLARNLLHKGSQLIIGSF